MLDVLCQLFAEVSISQRYLVADYILVLSDGVNVNFRAKNFQEFLLLSLRVRKLKTLPNFRLLYHDGVCGCAVISVQEFVLTIISLPNFIETLHFVHQDGKSVAIIIHRWL
jgi:hypothetical protein